MALLRKRYLLVVALVVLVAVGLAVLSLATVGPAFVEREVSRHLKKSAGAETDIKKAEINPFTGEVKLEQVAVTKKNEGTDFRFTVGHVTAQVSVKKLVFRQLDFVSVHVEKPNVAIVRTKKGSTPAEDFSQVSSLLKDSLERFTKPKRKREKKAKPEFDFVIHDLTISDGTFSYREARDKTESSVGLRKLNYHATEVSLSRFYRLLLGSNIEAELVAGKAVGTFKKVHAPGVSSVSVTGLDMTTLNSCIVPTDVFVISSGTIDAKAELLVSGRAVVNVNITGLTVSENPHSPSKTFLFIPARKVIKYVNRKGGNFNLRLTLSGAGWHTSEDLEELLEGFWQDLWTDIMGKEFAKLRDLFSR